MTTNFFNTRTIDNYNGLSDREIYNVLTHLLDLQAITKKILDAHDGKLTLEYDEDELEGLTNDELISLHYCDEIADIDIGEYNKIVYNIFLGLYFKPNYTIELFANGINNTLKIYKELNLRINSGHALDFDNYYRKYLEKHYYNINYCILVNFKLMYIDEASITSGIKYFCTINKIKLEDIVNPMYEIFKEHKPTVVYLNKHPELFEKLEDLIPPANLLDLVAYSDLVEPEEWEKMLPKEDGTIELSIDQLFIDELEERYHEAVRNNVMEELGGAFNEN